MSELAVGIRSLQIRSVHVVSLVVDLCFSGDPHKNGAKLSTLCLTFHSSFASVTASISVSLSLPLSFSLSPSLPPSPYLPPIKVVFVVGTVILASARSVGVILFGRFILGFSISMSANAECIYIAEIAAPSMRGVLVSLNELGITFGIMISYLIDYALIDAKHGWR